LTEIPSLPASGCYAVIFTSQAGPDQKGYGPMAEQMVELAEKQDGFLGIVSSRDATGLGITVSYWESETAIRKWRENLRHKQAQNLGKSRWYAQYQLVVARVERGYEGPDGRQTDRP